MKCIACKSTSLVEGKITHSDLETVKFTPGGESIFRRILGAASRSIRAYGCTHCGHLQLAIDLSEDDLSRYQSFEGEQPRSVVEQISDDKPGAQHPHSA